MPTFLSPGARLTRIRPYLPAAELELVASTRWSAHAAIQFHHAAHYLTKGYAVPHTWTIWDMLDPADEMRVYRIRGSLCNCPDWTPKHACVHTLVVVLAQRAAQIAEETQAGVLHLATYWTGCRRQEAPLVP